MGDVIDVYPYKGEVRNHETGELIASFELKTDVLLDEVRAGSRPYPMNYLSWLDDQGT